jgi:alpha-beta hydrolase superfamily lysophospholipase
MDTFAFKSGGIDVACYRWKATDKPVGILQIAHGMGEHALRYAPVA